MELNTSAKPGYKNIPNTGLVPHKIENVTNIGDSAIPLLGIDRELKAGF